MKPRRNAIDQTLGRVIRMRRLAARMSQMDLAGKAGISYQQIQKYEAGQNSLSAGRLFAVAEGLGTTPAALVMQLQALTGNDSTITGNTRDAEVLGLMAGTRNHKIMRALASCADDRLLDAIADLLIERASPQSDHPNAGPKAVPFAKH